ncbi:MULTISPECIES: hypothetical protein [Bacillaceae]
MFNQKVLRLLLGSTILSSIFSVAMIALTIFHHLKMQEMIREHSQQ